MTVTETRFILVDTNCFLRLYQSPALPLLGQTVGNFTLLTLESLVTEFKDSPSLPGQYPWVAKGPKNEDLLKAQLKLGSINKRKVTEQKELLVPYSKSFLTNYCKVHRTRTIRSLSKADLDLLATAVVLKAVLATDEWALRAVVCDLMEDPEYKLGLTSSVEILHLLETNNRISSEDRRTTVDAWVRLNEQLPRDWQATYQVLFGESADSLGQS